MLSFGRNYKPGWKAIQQVLTVLWILTTPSGVVNVTVTVVSSLSASSSGFTFRENSITMKSSTPVEYRAQYTIYI